MQRRVAGLWLTLTLWGLGTLALANSVNPNSWRPYTDESVLITVGMTKGEVQLKAGPPHSTEIVSLGTDGHPTVTVWTYLRTGHNAAVANLTFSGNKLVKIALTLVRN